MALSRRQRDILDDAVHGYGYDGSDHVEPYRWKTWVSSFQRCGLVSTLTPADRRRIGRAMRQANALTSAARYRWGLPLMRRSEPDPRPYAEFCQLRARAAGIAWLCYALDILYQED